MSPFFTKIYVFNELKKCLNQSKTICNNASTVSIMLAGGYVPRKWFFFVVGGVVLLSATLMETSGDVEICLESAAGTGSPPLLVLRTAVNL